MFLVIVDMPSSERHENRLIGSSIIWFFGMYTKIPELNAALFNAVYLSSFEFDDCIAF